MFLATGGLLAGLVLASPGQAQHAGQAAPGGARPEASASTEYRAAAERMRRDLNLPVTGDPDRDFAAGMIAHHQGAIDMARVQLRYGRDPVLRKMAEEIIATQEQEIAVLRTYLEPPPRRR
ncbi:DUF305 domain-containing protein [Roseomonas sp. M0104]|uniref:DUF305 domain-containing protein n=2 Tax=Teichococcus coralli TaxID=2545983 RepID=A0A845BAV1_9PROT|nr:DUF305 domain-containing protein [Pseudoroseomonas coralli]